MNNPQRLGLLFFKTTLLSLVVAGAGVGTLYWLGLQKQTARLSEELERRQAVIQQATETTEDPATVLQALKQDLETNPFPDDLGELLLGRSTGEDAKVLLAKPQESSDLAALRKAVAGASGTFSKPLGGEAIAAYGFLEELDWGLVVQTPKAVFVRPYLKAGAIAAIAALIAGALGTVIYNLASGVAFRKLKASEQRHRYIVDNAAEGIITINNNAVVETFNQAAEEMFGYSAKQVVGQTIDSIMLAFADGEVEASLFGKTATSTRQPGEETKGSETSSEETKSSSIQKLPAAPLSPLVSTKRELMGQRQDGTIFPVELAISRLSQGDVKRFLLLVRDISDRKQLEEALRKRTEELELRVEERTNQLTHLNEELLHEIAERNNAEETLQETEKRFRTLFNQAEVGIIQTTKTGQFVQVNPSFLDLTGYSEAELQEQTFQEITDPEDLAHSVAQFRRLLAGEIPELGVEQRFVRADGSSVWVQMSGSVVRDLVGNVEYFMGVVADIGDRVQAKDHLLAAESTLSSFFNSTNAMMGVVELVEDDIRHVSDNTAASDFFRLSPVTLRNQLASALGVPADIRRDWVDHCLESASKGSAVQFTYAYEPDFDNGQPGLRWFQATVSPIPGLQRFAYRVEDITAQRQQADSLEQTQAQLATSTTQLDAHRQKMIQLAELNEFLQASRTQEDAIDAITELVSPLFSTCSGAVYVLNGTGNLEAITHWGEHFNSKLLFAPTDSWAIRRARAHWVDADHPRLLSEHIQPQTELVETLSIPMTAHGKLQGLLYLTAPTPGLIDEPERNFAQTVAEQLGVSLANVGLRTDLKADPVHDLLTGLFNRRYFEEAIEREVYGASRQSRNLGVVLLDIDHFRQYNNTFGHDAGDTVLKTLGGFVRRTLHSNDIAARYGGEEIAVLLPDLSKDEVILRAEQLLGGVRHLHFEGENQTLDPVTVSIGIALFPENGTNWDALVQSAEMALSRAKVEGRDRICTVQ
ncbi:MAG: PAS domain S-box protein [Cyanobacteria bacterium P01_G01_bin.54]